jgi:hypothetical protein
LPGAEEEAQEGKAESNQLSVTGVNGPEGERRETKGSDFSKEWSDGFRHPRRKGEKPQEREWHEIRPQGFGKRKPSRSRETTKAECAGRWNFQGEQISEVWSAVEEETLRGNSWASIVGNIDETIESGFETLEKALKRAETSRGARDCWVKPMASRA